MKVENNKRDLRPHPLKSLQIEHPPLANRNFLRPSFLQRQPSPPPNHSSSSEATSPRPIPAVLRQSTRGGKVREEEEMASSSATMAYGNNQYKRDAAVIISLWEANNGGPPGHLAEVFTEAGWREARAVLRVIDSESRRDLITQAEQDLRSPGHCSQEPTAFQRFMERFREGPSSTVQAGDAQGPGRRERPDQPRNDRTRDRRGLRRDHNSESDIESVNRDPPPLGHRNRRSNRPEPRPRDNERRSYRRSWRDSSPLDPSSLDSDYHDRDRYRHRKSPRKHRRRDSREWDTLRLSRPSQSSSGKLARLQPEDVKYDGLPTYPVTSYIRRLLYLSETYGEGAVLAVLLLGMKGDAQVWIDSLSADTLSLMNRSLAQWIIQLRRRFATNASEALRLADQIRHTFENEAELDVRKYITKKQAFYREAGEEQEDLIVRRLHDGLDPTLAAAITLQSVNMLDDFTAKVYAAEPAARAQWKQMQTSIRSSVAAAEIRAREQAREQSRRQILNQNWNTANTQPRLIPIEAARRIAQTAQDELRQKSLSFKRSDSPTVQQLGDGIKIPISRRLGPPKRNPYPCTHCGSLDHIDPQCPQIPRRRTQFPPKNAVEAYITTAQNLDSDDGYLVAVDEDTFEQYQEQYLSPEPPDTSGMNSENETGGR